MININLKAAEVSRLTYKGAEAFKEAGYKNICVTEDKENETYAYVFEDDACVYVAFKVEADIDNLKKDPRLADSASFSAFNLHRGLWEAWREISDQVATEVMQRRLEMSHGISDKKHLVYCGHSLGGAIATIAAATHCPDYCITFGAPPVGGKGFQIATEESTTSYSRYVLDRDPVPNLYKWNPRFRHVGRLLFIDSNMEVQCQPSCWQIFKMRWLKFTDLNDHAMGWYKAAVWINGRTQ